LKDNLILSSFETWLSTDVITTSLNESQKCTHQDWLWDHLFWSSNAHFIAWIWVIKWTSLMMSRHFFPLFDLTSWEESMRKNIEHTTMSLSLQAMRCMSGRLDDFHEDWWYHILEEYCFNLRQVYDWLTILMGVGMMHTINQRIILRRIQKRKSFMMNQATPHLGAWSSLINSESSNRRGQPRMGTALTAEWMASTWISQGIQRTKKDWECKQRHLVMMEHRRGGDLYFESGKDACMSSNDCTYFFIFVSGKILNVV